MTWSEIIKIIKNIILPPIPEPVPIPVQDKKGQRIKMVWLLLLSISVPWFSVHSSPEFVSNIKFKELDIKIPKVNKEKLSTNISFYSLPSDSFPIAFLTISLNGGEEYTAGKGVEIPSLLADTLKFGGSVKNPKAKLISKLESMGAKLSISSGDKKISFRVSFLSKDQDSVLEILNELILTPSFDDSAFEKAKQDMLEGIKRRNDKTESVAFRKATDLIYRNTVTGISESPESVNKITKEDLISFWNDIVKNKPIVVKVTGKYQDDSLKKFLLDTFSAKPDPDSIYKEEVITFDSLSKSLNELKEKVFIVNKDVNQSMVLMTGILPPHNSKEFFSLQILNYILGGSGFNSYMMQQIRVERGLAYSAVSYPVFQSSYGIFYAYSLTKNETLLDVHSLMKSILSVDTFKKITADELEKAKIAINNQFVFLFTDNNKIVSNQVRFDEDEMPEDYLQTYRERINSVTLQDLVAVGEKYYDYKNLKTVIVTPAQSIKGNIKEKVKVIQPEEKINFN